MVSFLRNNASIGLLVVFLLSNYHRACECLPYGSPGESFTGENERRPEVEIPQGKVLGMNMITHRNRTFYGFKGIPFAQPPVGNLRFRAPVPANSWNGTLDGSRDSPLCPQLDGNNKVIGNEDCLYLNIYTPKLPAGRNSTLLPVMMFVFGGGFKTGTNNPYRWGPQFILNKDVVLIIPNYRMGVLGYLSTGDQASPGNYALKDLVQALKWNQQNIRYFGGDPEQVTIFGGSSGSISVHLLTLSDSSEGLFHKYVTQSGPALNPVLPLSRTVCLNRAFKLGEHLGCSTNTSSSLIECLRGFNASQLIDTNHVFDSWHSNILQLTIWGPTVEQDLEGALLTDTPRNLVAAGKIRDLPWICHVNRDDGIVSTVAFYIDLHKFQALVDNLDRILPIIFMYDDKVHNVTAYTAALKSYYLNDLSADKNLLLNNFTNLLSDGYFGYPGYNGLQQQLIHAKSPAYLSSFEYRGTVSYSYFFSGGHTTNWGAAHGDELLYLLPGPDSQFGPPGWKFSENDWGMVDKMVQLWTSFAIHETPRMSGPNGTLFWTPYSFRESYLQIGNGPDPTVEIKHNYLEDRMRFWKELDAATSWL